ncbi:MAG: glycosyl transferase [Aequorivita sp.]|nr:glycosyl transferase [Aequorivita sp.]MBF30639.1 glycosyl transferase [Aequorivita sp.]|tara:strand:- start:34435 stop:35517 length:1083 start_codon:yes stop_codon:yes gene_type:complete
MKVLQIINGLSTGGAEKLLVDSASFYVKKGLSMDVLSLSRKRTPFWEELEKNLNSEIFGLTDKSIYNPILIFKLIPYLKQYDIIHLHLFPTLYWVVLAKYLSFSNVKLIFTEHNTSNRRRKLSFFKFLDKFIYKKLNSIICITQGVKENLKDHLNLPIQLIVINNGIDLRKFLNTSLPKEFKYFDSNDFKIIQISSFRQQKDQATVIKSLKFLPREVKLILVGDGVLLESNKNLVQSLNLTERVIFTGNRYDIPELINYSDVVVLSSHWEGFGLAIVEGMAAHKPVIASNIEGIKEIVENYGLLFNPGDEKNLADLIQTLRTNTNTYKKIANACYNRAQQFDIERMVDSHIQLYKEHMNA